MKFVTVKANIFRYIWSYNPCAPGPQGSHWHHFLQIMAMVVLDLKNGMLNLRSAGLVYTTIFAFIPLLAGTVWVLKRLGVHEQLEPVLARMLEPLGEQSAEFSVRVVAFVEKMEIGLLGILGFGLLLFAAISLMRKIESAIHHTWRLQIKRSWLHRMSIYLGLLAVGPALVFSALAVNASLASHAMLVAVNNLPLLGDMVGIFGKFLPYMLVTGAFTLIYQAVPNTGVKFASAFYGGLIAGIIWGSTGILFAIFVGGSTSYTVIYAGFAILMLLVIWVYLSWLILLIGASIAYYHQHPERLGRSGLKIHLSAQKRDQLALQSMLSIARSQQRDSNLGVSIDELAGQQKVPVDKLQPVLDDLEANNLLRRAGAKSERYLPSRPIGNIRLIDIVVGSRATEDTDSGEGFICDNSISKLLDEIESCSQSILGEDTLLLLQDSEDNE